MLFGFCNVFISFVNKISLQWKNRSSVRRSARSGGGIRSLGYIMKITAGFKLSCGQTDGHVETIRISCRLRKDVWKFGLLNKSIERTLDFNIHIRIVFVHEADFLRKLTLIKVSFTVTFIRYVLFWNKVRKERNTRLFLLLWKQ